MKIKSKTLSLLATTFLLTACSSLPSTPEGFTKTTVEAEQLNFVVWEKDSIKPKETLRFYIEGNGTPNPQKAIALSLAKEDDFDNIVVLTRPCQYIDNPICQNKSIWEEERYHPEILKEMQELTKYFIKKHQAKDIELVAYDDAAPIAFNIAQRIGGTKKIVTIAGVLDVDSYAKQNNLPKFKNASAVQNNHHFMAIIPQIHYIGSKDEVVTRAMTERTIAKLNKPQNITVKVVHGFDHDDWDNIKLSY